MIREIMREKSFLSLPSEEAGAEDLQTAQDLLDTLAFHKRGCVGMAANMIGVNKRVIAVEDGEKYLLMFNPKLLKKADPFEAEEGCLSLVGTRKTRRYRSIKIQYQNEKLQFRIKSFSGWTAQIIQHELDHLEGILI